MPDLKKNRFKGYRKQKTTLNLLDLPNEILAEIFSYLKKEEIMKIIKVCKKLNVISKTPSLWKRTDVHLKNKKQVVSFCSFFKQVSKVQKLLFIRDLRYKANLEREVKYVRPLFKSMKNLRCLQTNFPLIQEMLQSSLLHLTFQSQSAVVIPTLTDLPNTPPLMLQFLRLFLRKEESTIIEVHQIFNNIATILIDKCYFTLEFLTVYISAFNKNVLTSIVNCYNLKELRLRNYYKRSLILNLNLMNNLSKLSNLETLVLFGFDPIELQLSNLQINCFQKLKYLSIGTNLMSSSDYDSIRKSIRNLNTFLVDLRDPNCDSALFLGFITNYKTLENVGIGATFPCEVAVVLLKDIVELHKIRHFKSVCLCKINMYDILVQPIIEQIKEHITCSECVFLVHDSNICPCYAKPTLNFRKELDMSEI